MGYSRAQHSLSKSRAYLSSPFPGTQGRHIQDPWLAQPTVLWNPWHLHSLPWNPVGTNIWALVGINQLEHHVQPKLHALFTTSTSYVLIFDPIPVLYYYFFLWCCGHWGAEGWCLVNYYRLLSGIIRIWFHVFLKFCSHLEYLSIASSWARLREESLCCLSHIPFPSESQSISGLQKFRTQHSPVPRRER